MLAWIKTKSLKLCQGSSNILCRTLSRQQKLFSSKLSTDEKLRTPRFLNVIVKRYTRNPTAMGCDLDFFFYRFNFFWKGRIDNSATGLNNSKFINGDFFHSST